MRKHYDPILHDTLEQYIQSMREAIAFYGDATDEHETASLLTYIGNTGIQIKQLCEESVLSFTTHEKAEPTNIINIADRSKKEGN